MTFVKRRVVQPVLELLRIGASPQRLAWSIAVGLTVGVNPLLGSTTFVALAVAGAFRLNLVASQFANHLMYPFQLLLFPVFVKLGSLLFGTPGLPVALGELARRARAHPWETTRALWMWEWHALVVWLLFAGMVTPMLAMAFRPVLEKMLDALHDEPVMEK